MKYLLGIGWLILSNFSQISLANKSCNYQFQAGSEKLIWTGYKFTKKLGVNGSFDHIEFTQNTMSKSIDELISSISFTVDVASLNSGLELRDKKLLLFIFGQMKNPGKITGKVISSDISQNKAIALISMNDVSVQLPFVVTKSENSLSFTGEIDLLTFGMSESFHTLEQVCKELHTGEDGISKSWSTVGLKIDVILSEKC